MAFEPGQDKPFAAIGNTLETRGQSVHHIFQVIGVENDEYVYVNIYIYENKNLYEPEIFISYLKQFAICLSIHNCSVKSPKKLE